MPIRSFEGSCPTIAASAYIDETALVIGRVAIGEDSSLWPYAVARGDVNEIVVGRRTNIQDGTIMHVASPGEGRPEGFPLIIGDDVTVGHQAILHACEIGHHCLIGMASTLMDGVQVEPYVIVAAGSLVSPGKRLSAGLWVGAPARRVRDLREQEVALIEESARRYARLHRRHRGLA
jgi:carbonic anhydrase/acetyltransferase-like protein (isoleucine patch superfamily)